MRTFDSNQGNYPCILRYFIQTQILLISSMKSTKINKIAPEIRVLGNLKEAVKIAELFIKKKTVVIFRNSKDGSFFTEVKGEIVKYIVESNPSEKKAAKTIIIDYTPERVKTSVTKENTTEKTKAKAQKTAVNSKVVAKKTKPIPQPKKVQK